MSKAANPNIYFDERAVRPQCYACNINYGGQHVEFCENLKQEIGIESFNEMYESRKLVPKRSRHWYAEQISYYKTEGIKIKQVKQ
jgi:hypothetical protein